MAEKRCFVDLREADEEMDGGGAAGGDEEEEKEEELDEESVGAIREEWWNRLNRM